MGAITRQVLEGSAPNDSVNIFARDFGVAITDSDVLIYVDGGNVGLLRLVASPQRAKALMLLVASALCEHERLRL
jgi:hypothetical protein